MSWLSNLFKTQASNPPSSPPPPPEVWTEVARWKYLHTRGEREIWYGGICGGSTKLAACSCSAVMVIKQSNITGVKKAEAVFIDGRMDVPIEYAEMLQKEPPIEENKA